jgi:arylsulfatase A-like enzyme
VDPKRIPAYPTFDDDLKGKPLRHFVHRDLVHCRPRGQWPEWGDWQPVLARNYEQQLQLDASIGRVLAALEETGQAENTMVIWQADHGDALGSHGGLWDKNCTMTQEVMRIPMAIRWPGRAAAGKTCEKLISNMDCTATMLAAAGVDTPDTMDSRSLVPLCEDADDGNWPDQLVCEHHGHGEEHVQRMVVTGRYKYVAAIYDGDELYDLADDPHETRNLVESSDHHQVCREMRQRLIDHIRKTDDRAAKHRLLYALERQEACVD